MYVGCSHCTKCETVFRFKSASKTFPTKISNIGKNRNFPQCYEEMDFRDRREKFRKKKQFIRVLADI